MQDTTHEIVSEIKTSNKDYKILLVDDDPNILRSMQRLLRYEGYNIFTASNANEAITLLHDNSFALIITDQRMPEKTGTELLATVQKLWPETVRIILTGYTEIATIIDAVNKGNVFRFIGKPWDDDRLKHDVKSAIEQYKLKKENTIMAEKIKYQNEKLIQLNNQLAQHFWDVTTGMTRMHDLLDMLDVAVLVVDIDGMIIEANNKVGEFFNLDHPGYIGTMAENILPQEIVKNLSEFNNESDTLRYGCVDCIGRHLQWRKKNLFKDNIVTSWLITIWQEII